MTTKNMTLRALEPDDLEFLFALENDPDLWAVSDVLPAPISRHALREYLRHSAASLAEAGQMRLIISSDDGRAVGTLDLYDYSALHQRAGVGITILSSERKRGYAQQALAQLLPYATGRYGCTSCTALLWKTMCLVSVYLKN